MNQMMMGNVTNMVPMFVVGGIINSVFAGFVTSKWGAGGVGVGLGFGCAGFAGVCCPWPARRPTARRPSSTRLAQGVWAGLPRNDCASFRVSFGTAIHPVLLG